MGTIYDQPKRELDFDYNVNLVRRLNDAGIDPQDWAAVAAVTFHIHDRDVHDEQMGGIANCLDEMTAALDRVAEAIKDSGPPLTDEQVVLAKKRMAEYLKAEKTRPWVPVPKSGN